MTKYQVLSVFIAILAAGPAVPVLVIFGYLFAGIISRQKSGDEAM
jgi:hypothetical protein